MTSFLIALNLLVILVVSYKALCRKLYLNKLKKKAMKEHKELLERKRREQLLR